MPAIKSQVVYEMGAYGIDRRTGQLLINFWHLRNKEPAVPIAYGLDLPLSSTANVLAAFREGYQLDWFITLSIHAWWYKYTMKEIIGWTGSPSGPIWIYGDQDLLLGTEASDHGANAGETVPPHMTYNVRKISATAGKRFRGSARFSPIAETDQANGTLVDAAFALNQTQADEFLARTFPNGAVGDSGTMYITVASKVQMVIDVPAFFPTQSATWAKRVIAMVVNRNLGSQNSRKPKSTDVISQTP